MSDKLFIARFLNIHPSGVLTALAWLVPHETAAILARSAYTIQPCTMSPHAEPHTYGACVFSCNLPPALLAEWPGSLHATAVTWGGMDTKIVMSETEQKLIGTCKTQSNVITEMWERAVVLPKQKVWIMEDTACTQHHWLERNKLQCPLDMMVGAEDHLNDCTKTKFLTAVLGTWLQDYLKCTWGLVNRTSWNVLGASLTRLSGWSCSWDCSFQYSSQVQYISTHALLLAWKLSTLQ